MNEELTVSWKLKVKTGTTEIVAIGLTKDWVAEKFAELEKRYLSAYQGK